MSSTPADPEHERRADGEASYSGRDESRMERLDRNLGELLTELRVALPGVQVLFAFLLVVPFSQRFDQATDFQRKTYFVVLMLTALASATLIAPTALHRVLFRLQMKEQIVRDANRLTIAGLIMLALAMTGAILLVTDVLFGAIATMIAGTLVGTTFLSLWLLLPLYRRRQRRATRIGH
jgi:hypothetical protein